MDTKHMTVIGLTGGIASGKSTVARHLEARGVPVIDADQVARDIVAPGEPALAAIAETFGHEIIQSDGTLNRKGLGAIVFADPTKLEALNAITHPAIMTRVAERLAELRQEGHPWVVYEAALVIEHGLAPGLSELVVVLCDPETQVQRVMARDGLDEQSARQRLAAQTDNATREARATHILHNDGSLEALLEATDALIETLNAQATG